MAVKRQRLGSSDSQRITAATKLLAGSSRKQHCRGRAAPTPIAQVASKHRRARRGGGGLLPRFRTRVPCLVVFGLPLLRYNFSTHTHTPTSPCTGRHRLRQLPGQRGLPAAHHDVGRPLHAAPGRRLELPALQRAWLVCNAVTMRCDNAPALQRACMSLWRCVSSRPLPLSYSLLCRRAPRWRSFLTTARTGT